MGSVGFSLKSSAWILIFQVLGGFSVTCEETWCYDKPSCGPETWGSLGSCNGDRQSPININHEETVPKADLGPITFNKYEDLNLAKKIVNKGYQHGHNISSSLHGLLGVHGSNAEVQFEPKATISAPGLKAPYTLKTFHLHWGTDHSDGSEHTINGKRCTMELHLVHTKNNMSLEEAGKDPEGLAVLSFFIQTSPKITEISAWDTLAKLLKKIPEKDDTWDLNGEFSMAALLEHADTSCFYFYEGSLTTPNCTENVLWFLFMNPIFVPLRVADMTNTLWFTTEEENRPMQNTFRILQPLNGRTIYRYEENTMIKCLARCLGHIF